MSIDEIIAGMTEAQKRALLPCAPNRADLPKCLLTWRTKPGHRYPSPCLNSLGRAVRARLEETND